MPGDDTMDTELRTDTELKPKYRLAFLSYLFALLLLLQPAAFAQPSEGKESRSQFHRLDFKIEGASCAACLIRLEKKFKSIAGMQKVMVSIHKPYDAVLISDSSKFKMGMVEKALKSENARLANLKESDLNELPIIIAPK